MRGWCLLIGWLLGAARMASADDLPNLAPGEDVPVPWTGVKSPLIVRLPDNYAADRDWPIVFHFHGSGGSPTIDLPRAYTGGKDFILVGMEYVTRDLPAATPDYLEQEWQHLLAVRSALAAKARVDAGRTYVGGFSQGGWFASEFMEVHGRELAGAYVLGAGKRPRNKREPKDFGLTKPVYLGAGQLDLNYIYAVQGISHFNRLGGTVTFDDFLGIGHQMPGGGPNTPGVSSLAHWFQVEAGRTEPAALRESAAAWGRRTRTAEAADRDPLTRWLRLSRARRDPFFAWLAPPEKQAWLDAMAALERAPALAAEIRTRSAYFSLVERELKGPENGDLWAYAHDQAKKYHALWQSAPTTYHGQRAGMEFARLRDQLNRVEMWRFPNEETKTKALASAANHPLPPAPPDDLVRAFRDWRPRLECP